MEQGSTSLSPNTIDVVAYGSPKMEPKHQVFLSHSGAQKDFVEQLFVDLKGCDRRPFFDKDWDSLPKGSNFPRLIFEAIEDCEVGVVVLSEEFFTSKWPMLELEVMAKEKKRRPSFTILPIFLAISIEECRDVNNRMKWLSHWQSYSRIDVEAWEGALQLFGPTNALIYNSVLGEVQFRAQIVEAICMLVPPSTRFEDSHVQGRTRLCKVIYQRLEEWSPTADGVSLVGIYGVGGIGKTTICKSMCNVFSAKHPFKVAHVELGSQSEAELFKIVLGRLSNKKMDPRAPMDVDELRYHLMRDMVNVKVFLAIDNVSSATQEQALTLIKEGKYGPGSVLLATARSLDELMCLGIDENKCMEMPELELEEVRSLFLSHATRIPPSNLRNIDDHDLISSCVGRCRFKKGDGIGYHYHPLALKVLGEQLRNIKYDRERWLSLLHKIDSFNPLRERQHPQHPVFSILRVSFDDLDSKDQLLFMDVALFTPYMGDDFGVGWNLFEWLGMVHRLSETSVMEGLQNLKRKSVVENLGDGSVRVGMHDLWREFARLEATVGKFEELQWIFEWYPYNVLGEACVSRDGCFPNLRRMSIWNHKELPKLGSLNFPHLTVLKLLVDFGSAQGSLDLKGLKQLRSLEYECRDSWGLEAMVSVVGLGSLSQLAFLRWLFMPLDSSCIAEIGCLSKLRVLELRTCARFPDLSRLIDLQVVCLTCTDSSASIAGLSSKHTNLQFLDLSGSESLLSCPGVGELVALQELRLYRCSKLKKLPSLHKLQRLRKLHVGGCLSLRALPGLGELVSLLDLRARSCRRLAELPDMSNLRKLRVLDLRHCTLIHSLPGLDDLVCLESLVTWGCRKLTHLPDLSKLTNLQTLELDPSAPLQSFAGWSDLVSLRSLHAGIAEFHDGPDLLKLTKLEDLHISGWRGQGFSSLAELVLLTSVTVEDCKGVRVLPDLRRLSSLRDLVFWRCEFEDLSGLCKLVGLKELTISGCDQLESLPDLRELAGFETLNIFDCARLRDLRGILGLHNLKELSAQGQPWLHESLGLDHQQLTGLRDLDVSDGGFANLRHLACRNCPIEEFPDLASFPSLFYLSLYGCGKLTDLSCSGPLSPDLMYLNVSGCKRLQGLPDLTHSRGMQQLDVSNSGVVLSAELIQDLEARWPNLRLVTEDTSSDVRPSVQQFGWTLPSYCWADCITSLCSALGLNVPSCFSCC